MLKLESSKFKSALDPNRQAFNNLMRDLVGGLNDAINKSTTKLGKINASYSKDIQLAEAIEDIFGRVNYKNTSEILAISKKLETLFSQTGLSPKETIAFLNRIGVSPIKFRASEAVRQISEKEFGANTVGTSFSEIIRGITSAAITPDLVKNIAIATGWSARIIKPMLEKALPAERAVIIKTLLGNLQE